MKHVKNSFVAFVVLLIIIVTITAFIPTLTRGQKSDLAPQPPVLDVKVVNSTSEPVPIAGRVNVLNSAANPLLVRDVDNPARQPVHRAATCTVVEGGTCEQVVYVVPAGKRFVVEYASMRANYTDSRFPHMSISTTLAGQQIRHFLPMPPPVIGLGLSTTIGQQVRLYADPGTSVLVSGSVEDSAATVVFHLTISGHLVDVQ